MSVLSGISLFTQSIKRIIDCLKKAPTHINGQFYSVIVVRDLEKRKRLVELNPLNGHILKSSVFLLFIADFNRSRIIMESNDIQHDLEKILTTCLWQELMQD